MIDMNNETKRTDHAERLVWERPVLRRLDASDAETNANMKGTDNFSPSGFPGGSFS